MAANGLWPRRETPLAPMSGIKDALVELRRQGWLSFRIEGGVARVTSGDRVRKLAEGLGSSFAREMWSPLAANSPTA